MPVTGNFTTANQMNVFPTWYFTCNVVLLVPVNDDYPAGSTANSPG